MNKYVISFDELTYTVEILDGTTTRINGREHPFEFTRVGDASYLVLLDNRVHFLVENVENGVFEARSESMDLSLRSKCYHVSIDDDRSLLIKSVLGSHETQKEDTTLCAPMPGLVVRLEVSEGDKVKRGQGLLVLEAMKMENEIRSPQDGIVRRIRVKEKMAVEKGEELLALHIGTSEENTGG